MEQVTLSDLLKSRDRVAKLVAEDPVLVIDEDGRAFGVFVDVNEFTALREIAEIAKDPKRYAEVSSPYLDNLYLKLPRVSRRDP